jgi:MerR family transcriptional regulator/heat shock protein HspR
MAFITGGPKEHGQVETEESGRHGVWQPVQGVAPDKSIFSIGTAATMLEVHPRTLRIYEQEGLVKPIRRGQRRYYSLNDLQWITCLRSMIHDQGISIAGIKKLLQYTDCWNIVSCPPEKRKDCTAYRSAGAALRA